MTKIIAGERSASPVWEQLETFARQEIQGFVQRLLEEEVADLLGRKRSERRMPASPAGYRNGYGQPRHLALVNGTITVRRPRVRDLDERFVSQVLPRFRRRTREVGLLLCQPSSDIPHLATAESPHLVSYSAGSGVAVGRSSPARRFSFRR